MGKAGQTGLVTGVLAIWHDIERAYEHAVLNWYNEQHHVERVNVPGFVRARRYVASNVSPRFFICYETESPEVMRTPAYLARVNDPTPETRVMMPHFRNTVRTVYRITDRLARPEGSHLLTIRMSPRRGEEHVVRQRIVEYLLPELRAGEMIMQAQLWEPDEVITTVPTEERAIRERFGGKADAVGAWALIISASASTALDSVEQSDLLTELERHSATPPLEAGRYELQYLLERDELPGGDHRLSTSTADPVSTKTRAEAGHGPESRV